MSKIADGQMSLWEDRRAPHSALQVDGRVLMESLVSCSSTSELVTKLEALGLYSKTFQEFSRQKTTHSSSSSIRFKTSGMSVSHGEFLMLNTSEWPSDAVVCSLSDTLEREGVPQRYSLSPRACQGILRRAAKRKKSLPLMLEDALTEMAAME